MLGRSWKPPLPVRLRDKPHNRTGEPVPEIGHGVAWEEHEQLKQTLALESEAAPFAHQIRPFLTVTAIGVEAAEVARYEDMLQKLARCASRRKIRRSERQLRSRKAEVIHSQTAELMPYPRHTQLLQLPTEHLRIYLCMALMQKHHPVAYLAESHALGRHMPHRMVQNKERIIYSWSQRHRSASSRNCVCALFILSAAQIRYTNIEK